VVAKIETFYADVGQLIRSCRLRLGLTQDQLGRFLTPPTSRVSVANVEAGKQRILCHTLVQFAAALKVELTELLPARKDVSAKDDNRAIADELVSKAGISKTTAKKLVENPLSLREWKEKGP